MAASADNVQHLAEGLPIFVYLFKHSYFSDQRQISLLGLHKNATLELYIMYMTDTHDYTNKTF